MQIINYFLLIYFIKYCNSFIYKNNRYTLSMSCDYYIDQDLHIYDYNNLIFSYINLKDERAHYKFNSKLDDDNEVSYHMKQTLKLVIKPVIIYSNNSFTQLYFENKYKQIIQNDLIQSNKTWKDINKIMKVEHRHVVSRI